MAPMNPTSEQPNLALFCDFENIALGVRDANYAAFDIQKVLERLPLPVPIPGTKAHCHWRRYADFTQPFE